jgi:hypothetical protein
MHGLQSIQRLFIYGASVLPSGGGDVYRKKMSITQPNSLSEVDGIQLIYPARLPSVCKR